MIQNKIKNKKIKKVLAYNSGEDWSFYCLKILIFITKLF